MTLQRLADLIGVYRQQIHVWEAGKVWPSKDVCRKLAEALGVSPRDVDWFGPDGEAK
jgi:DNA-binding XRE family transcriptional regulator